jgi:hypothetical protein
VTDQGGTAMPREERNSWLIGLTMMIIAVAGSLLNLYVIWRLRIVFDRLGLKPFRFTRNAQNIAPP